MLFRRTPTLSGTPQLTPFPTRRELRPHAAMTKFVSSIQSCLISALLLALFLACVPATPTMASPAAEKTLSATRNSMTSLLRDPKRSMQREPWMKIAEAFDDLYTKNPSWKNRVNALFRAASAYDELARRSRVKSDAEKAVDRYLQVADKFADSSLADDALLEAAKLIDEVLKDPGQAQTLVTRIVKDFPKGDQVGPAQAYGLKLAAESPAARPPREDKKREAAPQSTREAPPLSSKARITQVDWQSRKGLVKLSIGLDKPVNWVVYSQKPTDSRPARLVVELANTVPDANIKSGAKVRNSLLTRLRVDLASSGNTRLLLDFSEFKRFTVQTRESPSQLVITVASSDSALPDGNRLGDKVEQTPTGAVSGVSAPSDMARQLGLSVRTVVIDPGHGGNDPGTEHNGIVERDLTLSFSKRLGAELQKLGFAVRYTRTRDTRVELSERAKTANEAKGDVLVSIHVNSSELPTSQGFEAYFLDFASSTAAARLAAVENAMIDRNLGDMERIMADLMLGARTQESRRLASAIQTGAVSHMRKRKLAVRDGGLRSAPFHVLLGAGMPGVLVELGYCTNKAEAARLKDSAYLDELARGMANGINNYSKKLEK